MRWTLWVLSAVLLFLEAPAAAATYAVDLELETLRSRAEVVVWGEVSHLESVRGGPGIVTEVTVRVEETFVGTPVPEVQLTIPGGRLGAEVLRVSGAPHFREGQEVVLFLDAAGRLVGFGQGMLPVREGYAYRVGGDAGEALEVIPLSEIRRLVR